MGRDDRILSINLNWNKISFYYLDDDSDCLIFLSLYGSYKELNIL